jgi:hypothetical protein
MVWAFATIGHLFTPQVTESVVWGFVAAAAGKVLVSRRVAVSDQPPLHHLPIPREPAPVSVVPKGPKNQSADFWAWDRVDPLSVKEAAALWLGFEPTTADVNGTDIKSLGTALKRAVDTGKLKKAETVLRDPRLTAAAEAMFIGVPAATDDSLIHRNDLKQYAISLREKPPFLFPEFREPRVQVFIPPKGMRFPVQPPPKVPHRSREDLDRLSNVCHALLTMLADQRKHVADKSYNFALHWRARFNSVNSGLPDIATVDSGVSELKEIVNGSRNIMTPFLTVINQYPSDKDELRSMMGMGSADYEKPFLDLAKSAHLLRSHLELTAKVFPISQDRRATQQAWALSRHLLLEEYVPADAKFQAWITDQEQRVKNFRNGLKGN